MIEMPTRVNPELIPTYEDIIKVCKHRIKKDKKGYWLRKGWFERLVIAEEYLRACKKDEAGETYTVRSLKSILLADFKLNLFDNNRTLKNKVYIRKFKK